MEWNGMDGWMAREEEAAKETNQANWMYLDDPTSRTHVQYISVANPITSACLPIQVFFFILIR